MMHFKAIWTVGVLGLVCGVALAQDEDEVAPPVVNEPPIRIEPTIVVPEIITGTRAVLPGKPTPSDAVAGLLGEDIAVPLGRLLPEGAFLTQRIGGVVRAGTGEWIFISSEDAEGRRDPPVVLLPSATLEEFERQVGEDIDGVRVMMSGQIFVYHERNYMLPTLFAITQIQPGDTDEGEAEVETRPPVAEQGEQDAGSDDPRVAALLEQLEREGELTDRIDRPANASNAERGEALLNDGKLVIRQRGRVTRLVNGRMALSLDQDDAQREPIILLASSTLEQLESAIARTGSTRAVLLSGRQYFHRGNRYMLPISFVLAPPGELSPMQ